MHVVIGEAAAGIALLTWVSDDLVAGRTEQVPTPQLAARVAELESAEHPRWVWSDTAVWYPPLLAAGVRVDRCVDLRLSRRILRGAMATDGGEISAMPRDEWDRPVVVPVPVPATAADALFDDALLGLDAPRPAPDPVLELQRQLRAVAASTEPGVLALLLAGESVGSLAAAEMSHVGLPWRADRHDEILAELLGPRPVAGGRPALLDAKLAELRDALEIPDLDADSPTSLLRGLQSAGIPATSTRSWELREMKHPAIPPLLQYKKLARLHSANGWAWLDAWVHDGRFRPVYVVGGVVTGRWASDGGGAMQLPKQIRGAVVADDGWKLVVADAAQLEPRVLAAMSNDAAMARAGRSQDMYEGIVASGAVANRSEAKYGMLGAIYGGTSGVSGRVLPRIERAFPQGMAMVEHAAREGEQGRRVRTWLGRTSPAHSTGGYDETLTDAERRRAQQDARSWGRFTRNFIVQGTAAEWALCWMGGLRRRLWQMGETGELGPTVAPFARRPHLAFFLHDELVVHAPAELADAVADALGAAAVDAGRMLFPHTPVDFAVSVAVVDHYDEAK